MKDFDSSIFLSTPTLAVILGDFNSQEAGPLPLHPYNALTSTNPVMFALTLYQPTQSMNGLSAPENGLYLKSQTLVCHSLNMDTSDSSVA